MEMQEDSLWRLYPVHDMDTVVTNRLLYCDLYLRQYKETLKQTMLGQESVFETQIYELHRLYQRQKDLMLEMEETNNLYTQPQHLFPNAGVSSPRKSIHWMGLSISTAKIDEAGISGDEIDKSAEKVLDLEIPSYGDIWEEEGSKNGQVLEVPNFRKDQSPRSMSPESVVQPESVQHLLGLSSFKCILDLNEPARIEAHSDYELNQFLTPAQTKSERAEPEVQGPPISTKCQAENGIDLNIESEQPREFDSASLHGKRGSEPSRSIVLALPCSETISLFHKHCSRPRKKAKYGAKSINVKKIPRSKSRKGSNLESNVGVSKDDNRSLSTASYIPESDHNLEKGRSRSLLEIKRRRCKPHIESGNVTRKISRTKSKARGSFLVTEEEEQEKCVAAAEAIVDMSLSDSARKSSIKTSDCINPLHWFAIIASSVVEDSKSEVGLSVTGFNSSYEIDYFETMTLQLTEMKPEEQRTNTSVFNIGHPKHKRTLRSRGKRQQHNEFLPSLSTFIGNERNDAHSSFMVNMVIDWGTVTKRRRGIRSPAVNTKTSIPFLLSDS
ncbi:hypothetical protein ISN45_Aa08g025280 [Arabidopsis thaliana x Arabidopsis arenosa]|uniref:Uncharacterized protein n=1 Tax=Arabidopsis thaliana x Arabidopsis arenosa TaxID=1240361 RepID=A0A8T1XMI3_9BRAS|nr:hypothetical protein ISN45_Aa08g025280 [Arabidopsis thaliana x Arabidopsis arenosa]